MASSNPIVSNPTNSNPSSSPTVQNPPQSHVQSQPQAQAQSQPQALTQGQGQGHPVQIKSAWNSSNVGAKLFPQAQNQQQGLSGSGPSGPGPLNQNQMMQAQGQFQGLSNQHQNNFNNHLNQNNMNGNNNKNKKSNYHNNHNNSYPYNNNVNRNNNNNMPRSNSNNHVNELIQSVNHLSLQNNNNNNNPANGNVNINVNGNNPNPNVNPLSHAQMIQQGQGQGSVSGGPGPYGYSQHVNVNMTHNHNIVGGHHAHVPLPLGPASGPSNPNASVNFNQQQVQQQQYIIQYVNGPNGPIPVQIPVNYNPNLNYSPNINNNNNNNMNINNNGMVGNYPYFVYQQNLNQVQVLPYPYSNQQQFYYNPPSAQINPSVPLTSNNNNNGINNNTPDVPQGSVNTPHTDNNNNNNNLTSIASFGRFPDLEVSFPPVSMVTLPSFTQPVHPPPFNKALLNKDKDNKLYYAIDVECVATGPGHNDRSIGQISMVDSEMNVIANIYVKPSEPVFSLLPALTGLTQSQIDNGVSLETAFTLLKQALPPNAIIVGQNILKDIEWLKLVEGQDFASLLDLAGLWRTFNQQYKSWTYFSLAHEAKALLGLLQGEPHNAVSDAYLSIKLFNLWNSIHDNKEKFEEAHKLLLASTIESSFAKRNATYQGVCMGNKKTCSCHQPHFG